MQKIYYELLLDYICNRISTKHEFEYSFNKILQTLIYGRILFLASKLGTFEYASKLLEVPNFEAHDVYRVLSVIAEETDFIQSQVYKFSGELSKRNDRVLYPDAKAGTRILSQPKGKKVAEYWKYFPRLSLHGWGKRFAIQPQPICSEIPWIFAHKTLLLITCNPLQISKDTV